MSGWIGVDLDGTLAEYRGWRGEQHIGAPIPVMVERVRAWLAEGRDVRIFTARVDGDAMDASSHHEPLSRREARGYVEAWCLEHIGRVLPVTNVKDRHMVELWDDRCVQVETNTGRRIGEGG